MKSLVILNENRFFGRFQIPACARALDGGSEHLHVEIEASLLVGLGIAGGPDGRPESRGAAEEHPNLLHGTFFPNARENGVPRGAAEEDLEGCSVTHAQPREKVVAGVFCMDLLRRLHKAAPAGLLDAGHVDVQLHVLLHLSLADEFDSVLDPERCGDVPRHKEEVHLAKLGLPRRDVVVVAVCAPRRVELPNEVLKNRREWGDSDATPNKYQSGVVGEVLGRCPVGAVHSNARKNCHLALCLVLAVL
mmetsp:Transcript_550/g.1696  ORF Transcript_550/g.1696 Transcript_550/m.1696 type:complete len:248 (+) Transcript_550:209-952(+)